MTSAPHSVHHVTRSPRVARNFEARLAAAQGGDADSFEQLYRERYQRVLAFARVRGAPDPEGLAQEVFLSVYRRLAAFQGNEPQFNAWVFRIARNKLIDDARSRARRPVESFDSTPLEHEAAANDVEREVSDRLATESLLERLDQLTADQRDVVLLRVVADLTIPAIADVLGKRPGAVKALQRRAFRTIARGA